MSTLQDLPLLPDDLLPPPDVPDEEGGGRGGFVDCHGVFHSWRGED